MWKLFYGKHNERIGEVYACVEFAQVCLPPKLTDRNLIFLNVLLDWNLEKDSKFYAYYAKALHFMLFYANFDKKSNFMLKFYAECDPWIGRFLKNFCAEFVFHASKV